MTIQTISAQTAQTLLSQGAILIDIRDADEHAREHIPQARLLPLTQLHLNELAASPEHPVIFHCGSGARTRNNAAALQACTPANAYILEGGLAAWKQAGLPVSKNNTQPLPLQRQVLIAAGSIVLLGAVLGYFVSPWLHGISALAGAGLMFAGISGFCGMAHILLKMPWNRAA